MADELTFFQSIAVTLIGVFGTAISTAVIMYIRARGQCFKAWTQKVDKLDKRTFRIQKALILKAQMIDRQTKAAHPDASSELEKLVTEMLKDSEGNL